MGSDCIEEEVFEQDDFNVQIVTSDDLVSLCFSTKNSAAYFEEPEKKDVRRLIRGLQESLHNFKGR